MDLTVSDWAALNVARNDKHLARTKSGVAIASLDGQLFIDHDNSSSVSSWACHTNSPWTFTTLISSSFNRATTYGANGLILAVWTYPAPMSLVVPQLDVTSIRAVDSGGILKLLLTSGGITNSSISDALVDMLDKPIADSTALCVPTARWGYPTGGPVSARDFVSGRAWGGMTALEWKSIGILELTTLPTIGAENWVPWVREADVLLVAGGEATYLCHWMRESGLADLLPSLIDTVWVGVSAGSMVMTPRIGDAFVEWPSAPDDHTLGVVDFSIFPHLDVFPENTLAEAERWADGIGAPAYALDDQSAIKVSGGTVEVVSEGQWKLLSS